ncbi:50S ribosomal protein L35 [Gloeobacter kilaueensis]|uniref:Large ribosomal subunit protein bL35 n=1 Tax=Gloeobacter kilaueensis (strain ATCC BAA-2537 / CCAP 1431/1 / ULC 316 / JS1) TaxID=1183438 RepID=U5QNR2_GLOK1|nr:50S ribosomal protein L35 [Gloeobacter kilaueensis]AGY60518.1 50S ribosomal protein L35 [Gloeobacter kilaueensis JS1]
MPKMKTRQSAAKRYERTGSGKIRRLRAGKNHLMQHKSRSRVRSISVKAEASESDLYKITRQCPYL